MCIDQHILRIRYNTIKHFVEFEMKTVKMENRQRHNLTVATPLALFLIVVVFLPNATAESNFFPFFNLILIELFYYSIVKLNLKYFVTDIKYPTANQNLNPTQAWRSSEYCLWNVSRFLHSSYFLIYCFFPCKYINEMKLYSINFGPFPKIN